MKKTFLLSIVFLLTLAFSVTALQATITPSSVMKGNTIQVTLSEATFYKYVDFADSAGNGQRISAQCSATSDCTYASFNYSIPSSFASGSASVSVFDYTAAPGGGYIGNTSFSFTIISNCHTRPLWDWSYCTNSCPCAAGEGDCDYNSQCQSGLECAMDVGPNYGQGSTMDVCQVATPKGTIQVNSSPNYATIYIDNVYKGGTGYPGKKTLSNVNIGSRNVRVTKYNYNDYNQTVNVLQGQTTNVNAQLVQKSLGSIKVTSNVSYANVYIDNIYKGSTGYTGIRTFSNIDIGSRNIRVTKTSYSTHTQTVNVLQSQTTNVIANLALDCSGGTPWSWSYCTSTCPCSNGMGDCDSNSHCQTGTTCKHNVGTSYGQSWDMDVCEGAVVITNGTLNVTSSPSNADIFVDGGDTYSNTPATLSASPGWHIVNVSKAGYRNYTRDMYISAGQTVNVDAQLIPEEGYIQVTSSPQDADIFVDRMDTFRNTPTTVNASVGWHSVNVSKTDYRGNGTDVYVNAGQTTYFHAELEELPGTIYVGSSPSGAHINLDYKPKGKTPLTIPGVSAGYHRLSIGKGGYETNWTGLDVHAGQRMEVYAELRQEEVYIFVTSSPSDADIIVDGIDTYHNTPAFVNVSVGWHSVNVSKADYRGNGTDVYVNVGQTVNVNLDLGPIVQLSYIRIVPSGSFIRVGERVRYSVFAYYSDGTNIDVSVDAVLQSSNTDVASVSGVMATGISAGYSSIIASYSGKTTISELSVKDLCIDSDNGLNYTVKGSIDAHNYPRISEDSCCIHCNTAGSYGGPWVSEYYCDGINATRDIHRCELGCEDGACLSSGRTIVAYKNVTTCTDNETWVIFEENFGDHHLSKYRCLSSDASVSFSCGAQGEGQVLMDLSYCPEGCNQVEGTQNYGQCIQEEACEVKDTRLEGESRLYNVSGLDYEINASYIGGYKRTAKFEVNGEMTGTMMVGDKYRLSGGANIKVLDIVANYTGDITGDLVEFCFNGNRTECYNDSDCATTGTRYCQGNAACVNTTYYTCELAGTQGAYCQADEGSSVCEICEDGMMCRSGRCEGGTGACYGCTLGENCLPYGIRIDERGGSYCDISKAFSVQKSTGSSCMNNYECLTNQCSDGVCVDLVKEVEDQTNLLWRIWCKLLYPSDTIRHDSCLITHS